MFELKEDAICVHITVSPKASRTMVKGIHNGRLKVHIQAPPIDGRANEAVVELFSELCAVPKRSVSIERGETSRLKTVRISNKDPRKLRDVLQALVRQE